MGIHAQSDTGQQSLGEEALKETWKEHSDLIQIRTLRNAEGMIEENPVEGLAS